MTLKKNRLLGIAVSGCMPESVRSLDAFLLAYGLSVPIGIDRNATDFGGQPPYQKRLATLQSRLKCNDDAENPVVLYRRLLATSEEPVELLEIGYPQILAALLASSGDAWSPLAGVDLVRERVARLWIMAGKWDEPDGGRENNFARNRRASVAAAYLCKHWPTPVTFLGWEVGATVISGSRLPADSLLKQVLMDHGSAQGRSSWDPMLVLLAAAESPEQAGYRCVYGKASVCPEDGSNYFREMPNGNHCFVVKQHPDAWYADEIDRLL